MEEHEKAVKAAYRFEAKKDALRQNQDGSYKITINVHPDDMPNEFLRDPMGQRYMCAIVPLNDDETAKPKSYAGEAKLLAKEDSFKKFFLTLPAQVGIINGELNENLPSETFIENYCGVTSCAEIIEGTVAAKHFKSIKKAFHSWLYSTPMDVYEKAYEEGPR